MSFLHELGFSYGDLKPENVLITELGHIKVLYHFVKVSFIRFLFKKLNCKFPLDFMCMKFSLSSIFSY